MNTRIIDFLRIIFPFAITLFLWRLTLSWLNPGGLLALIPIFYCTFIRPVKWFAPFAFLMCFLVDYSCDTVLLWTSAYCLCYAANGFQSVIDMTNLPHRALGAFALFCGCGILVISVAHFTNITNIFRTVWTFGLLCVLYIPMTALIQRTTDD